MENKMKNTYYLIHGQECELIQEVGEKYLVKPIYDYDNEGEFEQLGGSPILVDRIFKSAPIERLDKNYLELCERNENLSKQVSELQQQSPILQKEVSELTSTKTNLSDLIVNYSDFKNATSITIMRKDEGIPHTISNLKKDWNGFARGLKFHFYLTQRTHEKREITCYLVNDEDRDWDHKEIEVEFGIMFDASPEEVREKAILFNENADKNYRWEYIPDEFLPDRIIELRNEKERQSRLNEIENMKNDILERQERLKKFISEDSGHLPIPKTKRAK